MVRIPYIKIPSVRVGSIVPTSNIGTGGATPAPPTPITYLTQWRMMGNSTVHTDKYLTQWKVEGNSVVDNNVILSCGDYSDVDGKYHVKISNGVTIYDIPLTEPLRKVNDVADTVEFSNGSAVVTRNIGMYYMQNLTITPRSDIKNGLFIVNVPNRKYTSDSALLSAIYTQQESVMSIYATTSLADKQYCYHYYAADDKWKERLYVYDEDYKDATEAQIQAGLSGQELIYELETPTTEVIQVSPFPVSPTDTYTSANDTPYSAFEYKKNVEIWSCGEYSAVDGKYHILVQPLGGSIADIALDEPLRKVNDVADTIEYANGVATLTRNFAKAKWNDLDIRYEISGAVNYARFYTASLKSVLYIPKKPNERVSSCLSSDFIQNSDPISRIDIVDKCMCTYKYGTDVAYIYIRDTSTTSAEQFYEKYGTHEFLYRLATHIIETIQAPQIQEAESYSCVISQGGKAVSWSSFETDSE